MTRVLTGSSVDEQRAVWHLGRRRSAFTFPSELPERNLCLGRCYIRPIRTGSADPSYTHERTVTSSSSSSNPVFLLRQENPGLLIVQSHRLAILEVVFPRSFSFQLLQGGTLGRKGTRRANTLSEIQKSMEMSRASGWTSRAWSANN